MIVQKYGVYFHAINGAFCVPGIAFSLLLEG